MKIKKIKAINQFFKCRIPQKKEHMSFYIISLLPECVCVMVSWLLSSDVCFVVATTLASSSNSSCISSSTSHVLAPPLPIPAVPGPYIYQPDEKQLQHNIHVRRWKNNYTQPNRLLRIKATRGMVTLTSMFTLVSLIMLSRKVFEINNYWLKYFLTAEIWVMDNVQ